MPKQRRVESALSKNLKGGVEQQAAALIRGRPKPVSKPPFKGFSLPGMEAAFSRDPWQQRDHLRGSV
jgi:hypothetical protein